MFCLLYKTHDAERVYLAVPDKTGYDIDLDRGRGWRICPEKLPGLSEESIRKVRNGCYFVIDIKDASEGMASVLGVTLEADIVHRIDLPKDILRSI